MEFEHSPNAGDRKEQTPLLKLVLELGPLIVFFLFNTKGQVIEGWFPVLKALGEPIFLATAAFMVAIALSLAASLWLTRRLPIMPLVSAAVVLVFGTLTLVLHDDVFIKLKPTIINSLFGIVLLGGLLFGKPLLGYVFDSAFRLTDEGWRVLTRRWGIFFLVLAVLNEIVWRNFSTDTWVNFKVFAIMPITIVFTLFQLPLIQRCSISEPAAEDAAGADEGKD